MANNYIYEGMRLTIYIIAVLGVLGGFIYLYKHKREKINSGYQKIKETVMRKRMRRKSLPQPQVFTTMKTADELSPWIENIEQRVEFLEREFQALTKVTQTPNFENNVALQEAATFSFDEFISELSDLLNKFRRSRFEQFQSPDTYNGPPTLVQQVRPEASAPTPPEDVKTLNDMNLIYWWQKKGYSAFSECKRNLNDIFGDVKVECVKGQGDKWNLIAVSNDGEIYYILLRKSGWMDQPYQEWFEVDEKIVRPGQDIKTLMPPLPKARKTSSGSGWQRVGPKGRVSIEESNGS